MATFYDTHAHLDYPDFENDFSQVLDRAAAAGISKLVAVGTDVDSSRRCVMLAEKHPQIFAVVGWHPNHATEAPPDLRPALRDLARHPKVVALGETGIDHYRLPDDATAGKSKARQADLFRQHLEVAAETGLNCVVHQRAAFDETLAVLRPFADRVRGVFHCFADNAEQMRQVVELGSLVSFTGILTFKNGQNVRDALAATPPDRFMLETDCPFLAPLPYRGKRCEPAYVKEIAAVAAQVKGVSLDELSAATCATAERFFKRLTAAR